MAEPTELKLEDLSVQEKLNDLLKDGNGLLEKSNEKLTAHNELLAKTKQLGGPITKDQTELMERAIKSLGASSDQVEVLRKHMGDLKTAANESLSKFDEQLKKDFRVEGKVAPQLDKSALDIFRQQFVVLGKGLGGDFGTHLFGGLKGVGGELLKNLGGVFSNVIDLAAKSGPEIGRGLATYSGTKLFSKVVQELDDNTPIVKMQTALMNVSKSVLQSSVAFGGLGNTIAQSMEAGRQSVDQFKDSQIRSALYTGKLPSAIKAVQDELTKNMTVQDAARTLGVSHGGVLKALADQAQSTESAFDSATAATLISNATGMEAISIAQMQGKAMQELGEDLDGSIEMFGKLSDAGNKSGIGMSRTYDSILKAADALKMYGGTINSVTPLFNMFSSSLEAGRKGLAPELLSKFTTGLESMSFSWRSFLGMQAGMGAGGGGALGAGLEMEAALEDKSGAGMQKVVDSMTKTLEKFGGGRVITRAEAIKDPALTNAFLMQRQMLEKMVNVSDPAAQNKILEALQKQHGLTIQTGSESAKQFGELISTGRQVGQETQTLQDKARQEEEMGLLKSGGEVLNSTLGASSPIIKGLQGFGKDFTGALDKYFKTGQGGMKEGETMVSKMAADLMMMAKRGSTEPVSYKLPQAIERPEQSSLFDGLEPPQTLQLPLSLQSSNQDIARSLAAHQTSADQTITKSSKESREVEIKLKITPVVDAQGNLKWATDDHIEQVMRHIFSGNGESKPV